MFCVIQGNAIWTGPSDSTKMSLPGIVPDVFSTNQNTNIPKGSKPCPICPRVFPSLRYLKGHMAAKHDPRLKLQCQFCGKHFSYKHVLKRHQESTCKGLAVTQ